MLSQHKGSITTFCITEALHSACVDVCSVANDVCSRHLVQLALSAIVTVSRQTTLPSPVTPIVVQRQKNRDAISRQARHCYMTRRWPAGEHPELGLSSRSEHLIRLSV